MDATEAADCNEHQLCRACEQLQQQSPQLHNEPTCSVETKTKCTPYCVFNQQFGTFTAVLLQTIVSAENLSVGYKFLRRFQIFTA